MSAHNASSTIGLAMAAPPGRRPAYDQDPPMGSHSVRRFKKALASLASACRSASKGSRSVKSHRIAVHDLTLPNSHDVADLTEGADSSALFIAAGREIDLYDIRTHSYKKRYEFKKGRIKCVSMAPSRDKVAVGLDDSSIQILHLNGGALQRLPVRHQGEVVCVEWSPDGQSLYSAGGDCSIRYWEFGLKRGHGELYGHTEGVGQVALSPDGHQVASASYDNRIKVWALGSRNCTATFGDHGFPVNSIAWLPDGRHLLSGSDECTVRLWDVSKQACLVSMEGHRDSIWRVTYSPEIRIAASGS
jgi:WD40 repeat protein